MLWIEISICFELIFFYKFLTVDDKFFAINIHALYSSKLFHDHSVDF